MRLYTEISDCGKGDVMLVYNGDETCRINCERQVEHDAMAAHAMLQAMDEAQKDWDAYAEPAPDTIKQRAAEILAGWLGEE